jgi:predicted HTH domain antitoxin
MDMENITIEVELPRDLLIALDIPVAQLGQKTKEWIVLELFREGKISSGKAGELLGMSKIKFIDLLGEYAIPYLDLSPGELTSDVQAANTAAKEANEN